MKASRLAAAAALLLAAAPAARAAELHAIVAGPVDPAFQSLAPACAAQGGDVLAPPPALDGAPDLPTTRVQRGLPFDVVILTSAQIDRFIGEGLLAAGSKADLGTSRLGMAVRKGAPKPDISTPEAFRQAVLNARSFGYSPFTSGNFVSMEVLPRLGIWDQVKDRGRVIRGEVVGTALARGDIEVGFQQVPELIPIPGIELVGPLPEALQLVSTYSAAVATASAAPQDARALVACLAGKRDELRKAGFGPVPR